MANDLPHGAQEGHRNEYHRDFARYRACDPNAAKTALDLDLLFERSRTRHGRVDMGDWLGFSGSREVVVRLAQIVDNLLCRAADHNPKCKVHFQADSHGCPHGGYAC